MGRPEEFDDHSNSREEVDTVSDMYMSETNEDLYRTPDVSGERKDDRWDSEREGQTGRTEPAKEPETAPDNEADRFGLMEATGTEPFAENEMPEQETEAEQAETADRAAMTVAGQEGYSGSPYIDRPYYGPYGERQGQGENPNSGGSYDNNPYGERQEQGENPYNNGPYGNNSYGNQQGQGENPYNNSPYGNNSYGSWHGQGENPYNNSPYGNNPYGNRQGQGSSPYNNGPYGNNSYGNQQGQGENPYSNSLYGNDPYGSRQGGGPYSPYEPPAKKNNTGLIIGIVVSIIILFLIAVFALTYKAVSLFSEERARSRRDSYEEYEFYDDREKNREKRREENDIDSYDYDDYDGYYDDFYGYDDYDYDYDDRYYTLQDDIKTNLTYSVDFEYYEYDTEDEDVAIMVTYPVIEGENVPNLEHLNEVIQEEVDLFRDYFEEEYAGYMEDEDSYFSALSSGYVTYMDEEKMSIVFSEYIYTDYYNSAYLYCINIDMENGVILDNENILSIDDDFSVEFRKQSDIQNDEIAYLTSMTDQEITALFNSPDIIVFYTPKGMEIGFNFEEGWVTVTYEEYAQYLKVF